MPVTPYLIFGRILDRGSNSVASTIVTAHDTTLGLRTTTLTNSTGYYVLDLANLSSDYSTGDSITVYVRNNGYVGETTFTLSTEGGIEKNITTENQVTLGTMRNRLWTSFIKTLETGSFGISTSLTDSFTNSVVSSVHIHSAWNDQLISSEGYPQIIIFPPTVSKNGITLEHGQVECDVNFMIEIYHKYSEGCKILTDEVENQIWRAQEVWSGLGLSGLNMPDSSNDSWTDIDKKIHRITLNANFKFDGVVTIP